MHLPSLPDPLLLACSLKSQFGARPQLSSSWPSVVPRPWTSLPAFLARNSLWRVPLFFTRTSPRSNTQLGALHYHTDPTMSASTTVRKPHRSLQKRTLPVMGALRRAASRSRSRTPVRFPSLARFMSSRSASSITLSFFSPASTPSPDQPLASIESSQRREAAPRPSHRSQGSATPVAVSLSPTPPARYRRYWLKRRLAARWTRKVVTWCKYSDRSRLANSRAAVV